MQKKFYLFIAIFLLSSIAYLADAQATSGASKYWSLKGNAGTSLTNNFLGTTDNQGLVFRTYDTERVRIGAGGNVGIGVKSPKTKLQVDGGTYLSLTSPGYVIVGNTNGYNLAIDPYDIQARSNGTAVNIGINYYGGTTYVGNATNSYYGLYAYASEIGVIGSGAYGIYGYGGAYGAYGSGSGYGVYGVADSSGYGGYFYNPDGIGVYGKDNGTEDGHGVYGYETGSGEGVDGYAYGTNGWGVYGYSDQSIGVYGNTGNTSSYAGYFQGNVYTTGTYTSSDATLKQNITDLPTGMSIINQLHPKTYNFRQDGNYKTMNLPQGQHYGLIAQDVEKVLPNLVKDSKSYLMKSVEKKAPDPTSTLKNPKPDITQTMMEKSGESISFKALNYTELIPIIIKGMQEQQQTISSLNSIVAQQQQQINQLLALNAASLKTTGTGTASLIQNAPNPFNNATTISYTLPQKYTTAQIIITNNSGNTLKTINVTGNGNGTVNVDASTLAAGAYSYSLLVDGKLISTKQMVLAK